MCIRDSTGLGRIVPEHPQGLIDDFPKVNLILVHFKLARFSLRQIQNIIDDFKQLLATRFDMGEIFCLLVYIRALLALQLQDLLLLLALEDLNGCVPSCSIFDP